MIKREKILLLILVALPVYLVAALSSLDKAYFISPVQNRGYLLIRNDTRGDGWFASKRSGRRLHNGIDLFGELGASVYAARSGRIIAATRNKGMGNYVIIRHANDLISIYGHLSEILVSRGQSVRQGAVVGRVGKTGNANFRDMQTHLHFEIRKSGIPQDPLEYLE